MVDNENKTNASKDLSGFQIFEVEETCSKWLQQTMEIHVPLHDLHRNGGFLWISIL